MSYTNSQALERQHQSLSLATGRWTLVAVTFVALTKIADAVTTYAGLAAGHREANPIAAAVIAQVGAVPALIAMVLACVITAITVIEGSAAVLRRLDATRKYVPWARASWYLLAIAFHLMVVSNNIAVLAGWSV